MTHHFNNKSRLILLKKVFKVVFIKLLLINISCSISYIKIIIITDLTNLYLTTFNCVMISKRLQTFLRLMEGYEEIRGGSTTIFQNHIKQ